MTLRAALLTATLMIATPCHAATLFKTFELTAANFFPTFADLAFPPISPVSGSFTFNFDTSASFTDTTAGLTVNAFNLPYVVKYSYDKDLDAIILATIPFIPPDISGCQQMPSTFCTFIRDASSSAAYINSFQQTVPTGGTWMSTTTTFNGFAGAPDAAVPEPATWAMMLVGFGMVGSALRARRRRQFAIA